MNKDILGFGMLAIIAAFTSSSFAPLPKHYHKVPANLIWGILLLQILEIVADVLKEYSRIGALMTLILGMVVYFLFRGISFMGLFYSFKAYAKDHPVQLSVSNSVLAWMAALADIVILGMIVIVASEAGDVNDRREMINYVVGASGAMCFGLLLTAAFLVAMNGNKNRVAEFEKARVKAEGQTASN